MHSRINIDDRIPLTFQNHLAIVLQHIETFGSYLFAGLPLLLGVLGFQLDLVIMTWAHWISLFSAQGSDSLFNEWSLDINSRSNRLFLTGEFPFFVWGHCNQSKFLTI